MAGIWVLVIEEISSKIVHTILVVRTMFTTRNSNVDRTTALAVTYSTLSGTSASISSGTVSGLSTITLRTSGFTGSTLTGSVGSVITANTLATSTLTYSTITTTAMYLSTLLVTSTLGVGTSFAITNGTTTGTTSTAPQYPLDVSGTARTATLQYYDNSASFSEQNPLNYTVLGQTWTPSSIQPAEWNSVAMSANGQYQVACVLVGGIWYSSTYGTTWTQSSASSLAWYSIALSGSGQYACAGVSGGSIWYSSTYGQTWTSSGVGTALWRSVAMSTNGQYAVACASSGALWYSSTYGQTWTQSTTAGTTSAAWTYVAMSASGQYVYACINGGGIWYSTTYGQTWTLTSAPSSAWSSITVSANGQYASACVNGGLIWYSTNYGQTWASTATTNTWGSIVMSASGQYQLATTSVFFLLYNYRFNAGDAQGTSILNYATGQYDAALMNSAIITTASYKTGSASLSLTPTYSQYVNLPPFTMKAPIGALTFCCWINFNTSIGTWARIFDMAQALKNSTAFSGTINTILIGYTPGVLQFQLVSSTGSAQTYLGSYTTPYTPSTGTWTHVAWTLSSTSWTIYMNGSAVTPTVAAAITQYLPQNGTYSYNFIGRSTWVGDAYGYGNYNDFRMYSSTLSAAEISAIYNAGNGIIGSQVMSTNFGATWTSTTGAQANWHKLAMSSTGQYTMGCIYNNGIAGNGILTSVVPTDRIAVSNVATVTENTATTMVAYSDGSVSQSAQTPLGPLDYTTFGQTWTAPDINKTFTSSPTVAMSGTGQVQALSTNPVALSPLTIMSGLQLWYDAADPNGTGVTPTAQTTISTWVDKSGNGRNAAVTGTFTVIPNTMNGLPVVSMTNPAYWASNYATATVNGATVFPTYFNVISVYRVITNVNYNTPWAYTTPNLMGYPLDQYNDNRYINSGANGSSYNISAAYGTVLVSQLFNSNYAEYLNGSTTASLTSGPPNSQATLFKIGTRYDNFTTFYGYMCEIIAYNTQMTTANQQTLEGYLAWKWGIQGNLPAAHPYKYVNPLAPTNVPFSLTSGLQLWLDASSLTLANGAVVSSWPTSGGTPYTFTSSNATYLKNAQNGLGVVSFAAGQSGIVSNFALGTTQTMFMLTYAVGQTSSAVFLEHSALVNSNPGFLLWTGNAANYGINAGGGLVYVNGANVTVANTWMLLEGMNPDASNSNQMSFYLNGALYASGTAQSGSTVTSTLYFNNPDRVSQPSYLAELLIYNAALTASQRQQVEGYLAWKWGIQSSLPATHMYRYINPSAPITIPYSLTSGLQLWLDASTLHAANGAVVSNWPTVAGTPYTFTSSNATYVANAQNGRGVVYFGAGQSGTVANFVLGQTQTIFMLTYAVGQGTASLFLEHGPNENSNPGLYLYSGGGQNYALNTGSGQLSVNTGNVTTANVWQLIEGMNPDPANSNQMAFYVNGALSATGTTQSGTTTVTNTLYFNNAGRVSYACYLAEILIYNVALNGAQRQQVEAYLMYKWGLQSSLPAGHLFKAFHPSNTIVSFNYGQTWIVTAISVANWASTAMSITGQYQVACINGGSLW